MNATEAWYKTTVLDKRLKSGDLVKVEFERVRVILVHPDPTTKPKRKENTYTPDFYCINKKCETEIIEIKGFEDEADRLKIKMAAELFPEWHWKMVRISRGNILKEEEF